MKFEKKYPACQEYEAKNYKGFKEKRLMIFIESIEEGLRHHKDNGFKNITLRSHSGGNKKQEIDLGFLKELSYCDSLDIGIPLSQKVDISPIYCLNDIVEISSMPNFKIDVGSFKKTKMLYAGDLEKEIINYHKLKNLKYLFFSPHGFDLANISMLNNLEYIRMLHSKINSLSGIERLPKLKEVDIRVASNLEDMSCLALSNSIESILIESTKKIKDFSFLGKSASIKNLNLSTPIESLGFVPEMERIESLIFDNVKDGDLNFLFNSNSLESVYFYPNKRNYTHSLKEIERYFENKV